jgi:hypothetical protein
VDGNRFDEHVRRLGLATDRRGLLAQVGILAGLAGSVSSWLEATAGNRKKKRKRRKKRRRRKERRADTTRLGPICDPTSSKKVAMCHVPRGTPDRAVSTCIAPSACAGHAIDPDDCVCGPVPDDCQRGGQPFPQCEPGRCRPDGKCPPTGQTCDGACNLTSFPCAQPPITNVANCRCQMNGAEGVCVDCPPARICGLECCAPSQICCDGVCVETSSLCGGICGNVCADEETCCGTECLPTASLCPDCGTICEGAEVCCDNQCVEGTECCENEQCALVCQNGICNDGECEHEPVPPGQQGPFCNRPGDVCCLQDSEPVCCQNGDVCTDTGCCTPLTCADFPEGVCGPQDDGCGGQTVDCPCPSGQVCGDGTCFIPQCVPDSFEVACAGVQCGPASDGCGNDYNCGECSSRRKCISGVCKKPSKRKRCGGKGLAGQPCGGKCRCKGVRRCHKGRCWEPIGDGSVHCKSNSECCPGLMCARRRPGQHKVCMRRNAKFDADFTSSADPEAS